MDEIESIYPKGDPRNKKIRTGLDAVGIWTLAKFIWRLEIALLIAAVPVAVVVLILLGLRS